MPKERSNIVGPAGLLAASLLILATASCAPETADEHAEAVARLGTTQAIELSGLRFQLPADWTAQEGAGSRLREVTMPGDEGAETDGTFIVYYFGEDGAGSVASNIARWCSQIEPPDARLVDARPVVEKRTVNEVVIHTVDAKGTYVAETAPGSGEFMNEPDQRLLAAVVITDAGPYYFKALGPSTTMRRWQDQWEGILSSIESAPVQAMSAAGHP